MTTPEEAYRHLRNHRDELTPPPGFAWAEISNGQILSMVSPSAAHDLNALVLRRQLDEQLAPGLLAATSGDVEDVRRGTLRRPDVFVIAEDDFVAAAERGASGLDPRALLLAVEIVSPGNPENDYEGKVRDYPAMGIPHYLIVDPRDGTCVHHWSITRTAGHAAYAGTAPYAFGDRLTIGPWTLDTAKLRRYPAPPPA